VQENVRRLEISVENVLLVDSLESIEELLEILETFNLSQMVLLLKEIFKSAAIAIFVDKVHIICGLEHFNEFHDIRSFDSIQGFDFICSEFFEFWNLLEFVKGKKLSRIKIL